jgi:peptidoglycan/LPS O-acetylase OafA/YrhL
VLGLFFAIEDAQMKAERFQTEYNYWVVAAITSVYFLLFFLIALNQTRVLQRPFFTMLGAVTYPLFLLHQNLGYMAFTYIPINKYLLLALLLVVMFALSYMVYRFVEKPYAKPFGRWLERRLPARKRALS